MRRQLLVTMASVVLVSAVGLLVATATASGGEASLWGALGVALVVGGGILTVGWSWVLAVVLWLITGASALLAGWLLAMEGQFFVGCGDRICEGGIPGALGATVVAVLSLVLGWQVRPRSGSSRAVNGPLALGALGIFCLGVTLIAVDRQRWLEEDLVGDALLPAGLAMVGVGILMVTISVGRRPATPRQEGSRADRGGHGCAYRRASHTRPNRSGALMSCRADKA